MFRRQDQRIISPNVLKRRSKQRKKQNNIQLKVNYMQITTLSTEFKLLRLFIVEYFHISNIDLLGEKKTATHCCGDLCLISDKKICSNYYYRCYSFFYFLFNFIETQHLLITVSSIDLVWSHQLSFSLIARNAKESLKQKHSHTSQHTSINNNAFNFMTVLDQHE